MVKINDNTLDIKYLKEGINVKYMYINDKIDIIYNNNNNNNLFLRSRPSQHTKLVYETPLFVGQGTPLRPAI
jgi:hypothetical protein